MTRYVDSAAVALRPMTPADRPAVLRLRLAPGQQAYVSPIADILADQLSGEDFHLIVAGEQVNGFFSIDRGDAPRQPFCLPDELGLLGFFVDAGLQGRGIGRAACQALPAYLARRYPGWQSVALTVNCRNHAAQRLYLAAGFEDAGELYHGGPSGPQHVYRMYLMQTTTPHSGSVA